MSMQPLNRISFDAAKLIVQHPPRWRHPNKQAVYDRCASSGHPFEGAVEYARWPAQPIPERIMTRSRFVIEPGVFQYRPTSDADRVEWHLNFSDPDLFVAYSTRLLAQDELQVAEHPILGSVREALVVDDQPFSTQEEDGEPTPVTVTGAQRRCVIDTAPAPSAGRPYGLYGNAFARAELRQVLAATHVLSPPTVSNILAIAAPSGGDGRYHPRELARVVRTAYSGYRAAQAESTRLFGRDARTTIHTGFWGCGAFGGNRRLMTMLQSLAADLAEVDMVFHAFGDDGVSLAQRARLEYERLRDRAESVAMILAEVDALGLEWGSSDGN